MTSPDLTAGRLGRRFVGHDPQNRNYGVRPILRGAVERKPTFWALPSSGFPLDQGQEGACEAFGLAQELAAGPITVAGMTDPWAFSYYRRVQATDRSMGNYFPDGTTTLANMKTATAENLITGYRWAFGIDDLVDTLCSVGPVCIGIDWFNSMYSTTSDGLVRVFGSVVGGHFILCAGYDVHPDWGPCVLWVNSWGSGYGVADGRLGLDRGVGWVPVALLDQLLKRDGEAVVPADFFVAPTPTNVSTFYATRRSHVFHTAKHPFIRHDRSFPSYADAIAAGLRPCKLCKPVAA